MFRRKSAAISRTMSVGLVVVLVLAVAAGEYFLSKPNPNAPVEIDIRIIEDDPVLQTDHFYPANVTAKLGENVTLAIQNGDDELRHFTLKEFNINLTLPAGTAARVTLQLNTTGTFLYYSPATPPSAVSQGRSGPAIEGNFTVTQ